MNNSSGRGRGRGGRGQRKGGRGGRGGRSGRGRGRGCGNPNNNRNKPKTNNHTHQPPQPPQPKKLPNTKKNGEKGADAHTVSETTRIKFTQILEDFRESEDRSRCEFPSDLTNTERKFLHQLALQLGLKSKSTGKEPNRYIVVTKRDESVQQRRKDEGEGTPLLKIGKRGETALAKHLSRYPPRDEELTTASSMQQVRPKPTRRRHPDKMGKQHPIDTKNRIARHAFYQNNKTTQQGKQYQRILSQRSKLPAYSRRDEIISTVASNPVTIIEGETGCGKSTQVPQFILDANPSANIAVTQPRRISAISIAERVSQEQCLGQNGDYGVGSLVGYQVRLEAATSKDTQLIFLTPGILLRKLQSSPMLIEYTHIVIDEVHERDKYTEFLLIRLRDILPLRPELRVVLMSATLQTDVLMSYFAPTHNAYYKLHPPTMLSIEGRTFPVQEFFLEHALELTEFIDVNAFDDDDLDENKGTKNMFEKPPMSMGQLDMELAKLMSKDASNTTSNNLAATMESLFQDDDSFLPNGAAKNAAFSMSQFLEGNDTETNDLLNADDFEEYDDYDEDGCQEAADYILPEIPKFATETTILEEATSQEKWDGEGLFDAEVNQEVTLTAKQEKYLKCYQTMYDDEQLNTDLLLEVLHYIVKISEVDGAILVFLPGWQEISEVSMLLENTVPFNNRSKYMVLQLHSGIPSQDQRRVLRRPPVGTRKIVLSTNIAETSLTIDDVVFVVDTGRAKEKDYDPHLKTSTLQPVWISKSSSKQRKGRAGRTRAGVCFHLFSSTRHQSMRPFVQSELLRTPLEEMCLMTKKLCLAPGGPNDDDGIPAFLSKAITPPHAKSVSNALELLENLGAMVPETNDLTTLGECLSVLSLEPRVGKMVIWSYLLGCTKVASQMAVAMSYKSPFTLPPNHMRRDAEKAQLVLSDKSQSDQVTVLNAICKRDQLKRNKGEGGYRDWCRRNFLNPASLNMIGDLRKNLTRELTSLGFTDPITRGYQNRHEKQHALWQAAIAAGLYPNVATRKQGETNLSTMTNRKAKIHVSSVNSLKGQPLNSKCVIPKGELEFVCYGEMVKGSTFFTLSQTTHLSSVLPILLLCGTSLGIQPIEGQAYSILNLDNWIEFKCTNTLASRLIILRRRLESAFWNAISNPSRDPGDSLSLIEQDAIETLDVILNSSNQKS